MRSFNSKSRPPKGAKVLRSIGLKRLRDLLLSQGAKLGTAFDLTRNRKAARTTAMVAHKRGRGYTKPLHGRSHTAGSGRTRRH